MFSTPSFFRFCWLTVQIERTNSYSMGMPRSKNTGGTFCTPQLMATWRKMWSTDSAPWFSVVTWRGSMP